MALLTDATVVEAGEKSGTLYQGWEALRLGRQLFLTETVAKDPNLIKPNIASIDYLERRDELLRDVTMGPDLPRGLRPGVLLKQHQVEGLAWLQHLFRQSPEHGRGAVLADDMVSRVGSWHARPVFHSRWYL